jgi:hypothetical protein
MAIKKDTPDGLLAGRDPKANVLLPQDWFRLN